jgi:hypothetical protein
MRTLENQKILKTVFSSVFVCDVIYQYFLILLYESFVLFVIIF